MEDKQIIDLIRTALDEVAPGRTFPDLAFATNIEALGLDSIATMEMVGSSRSASMRLSPTRSWPACTASATNLAGLIKGGRVEAA